jgi:hypothetical protein
MRVFRDMERSYMAGEVRERPDNEWRGSPLQMGRGMDPHGITEVVIEFDRGEDEVLQARRRDEFGSYELHQTAAYLETVAHDLRLSGR